MDDWKDSILKDRPRLSPDAKFNFACHKGITCFGRCCGNVNIFLTPYDVLRMKHALGISSEEFLEKYTLPLILEEQQLPVALLKMGDDEDKRCPFVSPEGCGIYPDRPWACRMYPLGLASSQTQIDGEDFCFLVDDDSLCQGFKEDREWTVKQWLTDQEVDSYNRESKDYMALTLHRFFQEGKKLEPAQAQMFYQTLYNLDKFRSRLFESSFFDRFEVDEELMEQLRTDDEALLDFGIKWLRFALFGEKTMKVKKELLAKKKGDSGPITE